ncbi:hypothetical protein AAHZ94_02230 [Streptomyces sp. HSW2009]|uniref:hypothetical protein n=1 Tax=Streptomyces sp. HSW2009 TaxID=3142890 RepID=UPI0032EFEC0D
MFDSAGEHLGGVLGPRTAEIDGLVCGEQGHTHRFETVLDECAEVRASGNAFDGLADDGIEVSFAVLGHGEEVLDASVARYGNVEALVPLPVAPRCQILTA